MNNAGINDKVGLEHGTPEQYTDSLGTRMFMIMEVNQSFSFEKKAKADEQDAKVQAWEQLMWRFQQALPEAKPGEKWLRMERIFKLEP